MTSKLNNWASRFNGCGGSRVPSSRELIWPMNLMDPWNRPQVERSTVKKSRHGSGFVISGESWNGYEFTSRRLIEVPRLKNKLAKTTTCSKRTYWSCRLLLWKNFQCAILEIWICDLMMAIVFLQCHTPPSPSPHFGPGLGVPDLEHHQTRRFPRQVHWIPLVDLDSTTITTTTKCRQEPQPKQTTDSNTQQFANSDFFFAVQGGEKKAVSWWVVRQLHDCTLINKQLESTTSYSCPWGCRAADIDDCFNNNKKEVSNHSDTMNQQYKLKLMVQKNNSSRPNSRYKRHCSLNVLAQVQEGLSTCASGSMAYPP